MKDKIRDDKLEMVYESLLNDWYSTNEEEEMDCPEGQHWCPVEKKCIVSGPPVEEASTLEGNWKPFAQRFGSAMASILDASKLIKDDKMWHKKVMDILGQMTKLSDEMNKVAK